ncbi:MAG: SH3 domain-containing protein [Pleurocapsa minor GSE-CHR-MK-17-07R]|nr:SH3 domain-containing protein [Pleurocapsa minor GSE-CHR-MK 17-07R]
MKARFLMFVIALACLTGAIGVLAQVAPFSPPTVTTFREAYIFAGPGPANPQVGTLYADQPVLLVERNRAGNWVRIQMVDANGFVYREGWILSGYLNERASLAFSQVPINPMPDNNPEYSATFSQRELYAVPYVPAGISQAMLDVYARGQALGNLPNVITKVGDSLVASDEYLTPMAHPSRALSAFDFLTPIINQYGASMALPSAAASIGLSSFAVVDPMWANPELGCQPGETPLTCEYRVKRPVVAFIMFGPNDVRAITDVGFGQQMRAIVMQTMEAGVIPVLNLFSIHPNDQYQAQAINFNRQLIALANELQVPLINLWAGARSLPNYGLDIDNIHLTYSGYDYLFYDGGNDAYSGVALHNLFSLVTLGQIQQAVAPLTAPTPEAVPTASG